MKYMKCKHYTTLLANVIASHQSFGKRKGQSVGGRRKKKNKKVRRKKGMLEKERILARWQRKEKHLTNKKAKNSKVKSFSEIHLLITPAQTQRARPNRRRRRGLRWLLLLRRLRLLKGAREAQVRPRPWVHPKARPPVAAIRPPRQEGLAAPRSASSTTESRRPRHGRGGQLDGLKGGGGGSHLGTAPAKDGLAARDALALVQAQVQRLLVRVRVGRGRGRRVLLAAPAKVEAVAGAVAAVIVAGPKRGRDFAGAFSACCRCDGRRHGGQLAALEIRGR